MLYLRPYWHVESIPEPNLECLCQNTVFPERNLIRLCTDTSPEEKQPEYHNKTPYIFVSLGFSPFGYTIWGVLLFDNLTQEACELFNPSSFTKI